jgi:hypothetical protein
MLPPLAAALPPSGLPPFPIAGLLLLEQAPRIMAKVSEEPANTAWRIEC